MRLNAWGRDWHGTVMRKDLAMDADTKQRFATEARRCREKAQRCTELAQCAHLAGIKDVLSVMAQDYLDRASAAEAQAQAA